MILIRCVIFLLSIHTGLVNPGIRSESSLISGPDTPVKLISLLSAKTTPDQLARMQRDLTLFGIVLSINRTIWTGDFSELEEVEGYISFPGTTYQHHFMHRFNILNKSTTLVIIPRLEGKYGMLRADAGQLNHILTEVLEEETFDAGNMNLITSFNPPMKSISREEFRATLHVLTDHFKSTIKLLRQIREDREPGIDDPNYRYYYNGQRLDGSFGISEIDMASGADIRIDDDGILSLFFTSDIPLSPFAIRVSD